MRTSRVVVMPFLLLTSVLLGCGGAMVPKLSSTDVHVRTAPKDPNRCVVASSHREPLVTEWSASSKSRLEVLLVKTLANTDRYAVAVEYSGCELRIVDTCRPKAAYDWSKSTLSRDTVEINDADDLYAKLPLGAVNLEGALRRSGRLSIQTTVAGQILLDRTSIDFNLVASDPGCAEATHVIQAVSIGAFKMVEGGQGQASAGAGVTGIAHGGASTSRTEQVMRTAGSDADCEQTTEGKPHHGCRSPLQLFLVPIPHKTEKVVLRPTAPELITPVPALEPPIGKTAVPCSSHVDCPSYTFCVAYQCVSRSSNAPAPSSEEMPPKMPSTDSRASLDTGWAYGAGIYGLVSYMTVLGLGAGAEATRGDLVPSLPLGSAATAIHLASVPLISAGGASARDSAGVNGIPAVRMASWTVYALSAAGAATLVGVGVADESPPSGVIASVTGLMCLSGALMSVDAFISDSQANRKLARRNSSRDKTIAKAPANRWVPLVTGTPNLLQVGFTTTF